MSDDDDRSRITRQVTHAPSFADRVAKRMRELDAIEHDPHDLDRRSPSDDSPSKDALLLSAVLSVAMEDTQSSLSKIHDVLVRRSGR